GERPARPQVSHLYGCQRCRASVAKRLSHEADGRGSHS
ncbi:hypothetical protein, partial [Cronobacter sakazakii]